MKASAVIVVAVTGLVSAESSFAGDTKGIAKYFEENASNGGRAKYEEGEAGYAIGCGLARKYVNPDLCGELHQPLPQPPVAAPGSSKKK